MTNSLGQDLWDIYEDLKESNRIGFLTDDEFQKYFLGFISYKYLSEKLEAFVNNKLKYENLNFEEAYKHDDYKKSLREDSIKEIGYFLKPDLLFKNILYSNNIGNLNEELEKAFNEISDSSIGTKSEEDFQNLFEGVDLNASQLGKEKKEKNKVIFNILEALSLVYFDLDKEGMDNRIFRKTILENSKFDKMDNELSLLDNKVGRWSKKRQNEYYSINAKQNSIQKDFADLDRLVDANMETELKKEVMAEADSSYFEMEENLSYKNEKEIDNLIGSGFEYLLSKFSLNSSNSADFYTPNEVSTLIAALIASKKSHLDSVYDPCCGSASLLLEIHKTISCDAIYGQEINASFYNIARENMILHNIHYGDFDIKQGDTLEQPQHLGESFEAVVSQIPFNSKWSADKSFRKDIRFNEYNILAPRTKADYAFIQHMIYHLRYDGIMLVVAPLGVLFRGSAEGRIRRKIVEDMNCLDAVIGLPANMFYSTNNPACLMIFRKDRYEGEGILFIDASRDFKKSKLINRLTQEDIENIVNTYRFRKEKEKYSYMASLDEIVRNDFNLNIPRYVDAFEDKEEKIDPKELSDEHDKLLAEIAVLNREIEMVSKELNIKDIFYK